MFPKTCRPMLRSIFTRERRTKRRAWCILVIAALFSLPVRARALGEQGAHCAVDGDCNGLPCRDGYCCNSTCTGCLACNAADRGGPGVNGVCSLAPARAV